MTDRFSASAGAPGADVSAASAVGYGISLAVRLPRDALSVPVVRRLVRYALDQVGVLPAVSADVEIALTEACANVLDHSGRGDAYDVTVRITPDTCELRIIDVGHGFDHASVAARADADAPDLTAERGRGLTLMRALVDHIELTSVPEAGTLVRLVKRLAFDEAAPARRLLACATDVPPDDLPARPAPRQAQPEVA